MSYLSRLFGYHVTCWSIWLLCELGYTVYLVCRTCLRYGAYHWSNCICSIKHLVCAPSDCAALSLISILMPLFVGFIQCQIQASWSCHVAVCNGSQQVRLTCLAMFFMLSFPLKPLFFRLFLQQIWISLQLWKHFRICMFL